MQRNGVEEKIAWGMGLLLSGTSFRLVKEGTERINSVRTKTRGQRQDAGFKGRQLDSRVQCEQRTLTQACLFATVLIQWRTCSPYVTLFHFARAPDESSLKGQIKLAEVANTSYTWATGTQLFNIYFGTVKDCLRTASEITTFAFSENFINLDTALDAKLVQLLGKKL